jgi:flagellar motor switch protein FliN
MKPQPHPDGAPERADATPEAKAKTPKGPPLVGLDSAIFKEVQVDLKVRLGLVRLSVEELLALKSGSVLTLDSKLSDPVELRLNDSVVAMGEIVAVGGQFGVRITDVAKTS